MSTQAQVLIDSGAIVAAADDCVIPILAGAVTGTGGAIAAQITLADLATFFESGNAPVHITSADAAAFSVGLTGATNPAFNVDASTASQAAGLNVIGAVAAGVVAVAVISSGSAASLTMDAKGTGTIGIGTLSTGAVSIGNTVNLTGTTVSLSTAGAASSIAGTTVANVADTASGAITIKGHIGRGTGAVGGLIFQVPVTTSTGTTAQTLTTALQISATTVTAVKVIGAFGCNNATPQTPAVVGAALASYGTGVFGLDSDANMQALYDDVVVIRAALVANGILSVA